MVVATAATLVLVGCGGSQDKAGDGGGGAAGLPTVPAKSWVDQTGKDTIEIDVRDNLFVPENIVVSPGTKIVFKNSGRNPHNVIPVDKADFDEIPVSKLQPSDSAELTLKGAGEIPYYCSLHGTPKAGMKGRIKVAEG